jgi:hypothetical protein
MPGTLVPVPCLQDRVRGRVGRADIRQLPHRLLLWGEEGGKDGGEDCRRRHRQRHILLGDAGAKGQRGQQGGPHCARSPPHVDGSYDSGNGFGGVPYSLLSLLAAAAAWGRRHGDNGNNSNDDGNNGMHSNGGEHGDCDGRRWRWHPAATATAVLANAVTCACVLCQFVSPALLIGSH